MSTPFVSFPNTATDYVFTNDVNLMDADSSHLYQSQGEWTNLGSTVTRAADAEGRYGYVMELLSGGVGARMRFGPGSPSVASELVAVPSLTEITLTGRVKGTSAARAYWYIEEYTAAFASLGQTNGPTTDPISADTWFTLSQTITTQATTAYVQPVLYWRDSAAGGDSCNGETLYSHSAQVAVGTDTTFVPSLNVVGTLFEEKSESGITAALTSGVLTVGKSFDGDGYYYRRYDGADATAPLVAEFLASDVLAAL